MTIYGGDVKKKKIKMKPGSQITNYKIASCYNCHDNKNVIYHMI